MMLPRPWAPLPGPRACRNFRAYGPGQGQPLQGVVRGGQPQLCHDPESHGGAGHPAPRTAHAGGVSVMGVGVGAFVAHAL